MIRAAYILRSPDSVPGVFDSLFGGVFLIKGVPLAGQILVLLLLPLALGLLVVEQARGDRRAGRAAEIVALGIFLALGVFTLQPWDEVFINLRHSRHWAEGGAFSFNRGSLVEGTVDFLPYLGIGWLNRLGLPLTELAFLASFAGGLLCLAAGRRLAVAWGLARWRSAVVLALATFAPLVFNSSNGFINAIFAGAMLWAIGDLFFLDRAGRGMAVLSLLPTIRLEGAWFAALLLALQAWHHRRALRWLPLVALPTLALSLYRWRVFGSAIPVPIRYKAGTGSFFLGVVGLRNAAADVIATGVAVALFGWALARLLAPGTGDRRRTQVALLLALGSAPYYLSGGDWFPSYWARYLLPFTLFAVLAAAARIFTAWPKLGPGARRLIAGVALLHVLWPISSYYKLGEHFFAHRRTMARIHEPTIARGHYRVQNLSQLGEHLRRSTLPTDIIASSEIATIMYFADRDALDLLGVANPEVAAAPLRDFPSLLRRFPDRPELPYLIFKRLRPDLLEKHRPPYLYTFDFMIRDHLKEIPHDELTDADIFRGLHRWELKLGPLMEPLYGGLDRILQLGYRPIVVSYANGFLNLYFVSAEARERHLSRLKELGFAGGWVENDQE